MESILSYKDSLTYLIVYSKHSVFLMNVCFHATPLVALIFVIASLFDYKKQRLTWKN